EDCAIRVTRYPRHRVSHSIMTLTVVVKSEPCIQSHKLIELLGHFSTHPVIVHISRRRQPTGPKVRVALRRPRHRATASQRLGQRAGETVTCDKTGNALHKEDPPRHSCHKSAPHAKF